MSVFNVSNGNRLCVAKRLGIILCVMSMMLCVLSCLADLWPCVWLDRLWWVHAVWHVQSDVHQHRGLLRLLLCGGLPAAAWQLLPRGQEKYTASTTLASPTDVPEGSRAGTGGRNHSTCKVLRDMHWSLVHQSQTVLSAGSRAVQWWRIRLYPIDRVLLFLASLHGPVSSHLIRVAERSELRLHWKSGVRP